MTAIPQNEIERAEALKSGVKFDAGKARFDLIPAMPLYELAKLYARGAEKYNDRNWEKGMSWGRTFAALMRHAWKWWWGERFDQRDGQHHLASVAWCAFSLLEWEVTHPEFDDRSFQNYEKSAVGKGLDDPMEETFKLVA